MFRSAYVDLPAGELARRAERAVASLAHCRACPRDCGVDRLANAWAVCKTGRHAVVSSWFPHFGEEDCLRGWNGSGTIFFGHCNLRCAFCQNYEISQAIKPHEVEGDPPARIASIMLALQARGCHNINFVTPEHVVPNVLESVAIAVERGLRLPLVYNTSAYDSVESIESLAGVVDIYLPDFKYWSAEKSRRYLKADDYPDAARRTIRSMYEQVGPLVVDENGLARRGVLIRHLVMPGCLDETRAILEWIAAELGRDVPVNLMDQYRPAGKVGGERFPEIGRRITAGEYEEARRIAADLGLRKPPVAIRHGSRNERSVSIGF